MDPAAMPGDVSVMDLIRPGGVPVALVVLAGTWLAGRLLTDLAERAGQRWGDRRLLINQVGTILRFVVYLVGLALAAGAAVLLTEQVLLGLTGTIAVTVGFAVKDLAASVIAGIIILVDRPFQVGDRVAFGGFYGEITAIGLRSVRLVTLDDNVVTIPNNKFLTEPVSSGNWGALDMLVQVDLHIGIDQDVARARAVVTEAVAGCRHAYLGKPAVVVVSEAVVGQTPAFRVRVKVYVLDVVYEKALETEVVERCWEALRAAAIQPPALLTRASS